MIRDLDDTIKHLLTTYAPVNSELAGAEISFDIPDSQWRAQLAALTVNCYLYDIRHNPSMQTNERLVVESADKSRRARVAPPRRIDCAYCITAWSPAVSGAVYEEHRLLSQVLQLFLMHPTIPQAALKGGLIGQIPPYPALVASPDGVRNLPEFWSAMDQRLKPSLNYVITLAMMIETVPADADMSVLPTVLKVKAEQP